MVGLVVCWLGCCGGFWSQWWGWIGLPIVAVAVGCWLGYGLLWIWWIVDRPVVMGHIMGCSGGGLWVWWVGLWRLGWVLIGVVLWCVHGQWWCGWWVCDEFWLEKKGFVGWLVVEEREIETKRKREKYMKNKKWLKFF